MRINHYGVCTCVLNVFLCACAEQLPCYQSYVRKLCVFSFLVECRIHGCDQISKIVKVRPEKFNAQVQTS